MSDSGSSGGDQHIGGPDIGSDRIQVHLTVPNHDVLRQMMAAINEHEVPIRTKKLIHPNDNESDPVTVNLGELTSKQRQTLAIAVDSGYYEQPRQTDLAALADRTGVSKSAVSQRLRGGEAKIIKNCLGTRTP